MDSTRIREIVNYKCNEEEFHNNMYLNEVESYGEYRKIDSGTN